MSTLAKGLETLLCNVGKTMGEVVDRLEQLRGGISEAALDRMSFSTIAWRASREDAEKHGSQLLNAEVENKRLCKEAEIILNSAGRNLTEALALVRQNLVAVVDRYTAAEAALAAATARAKEHSPANKTIREKVFHSNEGRCFYCEVLLLDAMFVPVDGTEPDRAFHVDHVVPKAHGGPDHLSNYVPSCAKCNSAKSDKPLVEFVHRMRPVLKVVGGTDK